MITQYLTWKAGVVALAVVLTVSAGAYAQLARAMVEKPDFEVLKKGDGYEIRSYPACIVAQVEIEGEAAGAMSRGFRPLADFIFGENVSAAKIEMTSPVTQEAKTSEKIAMTSPVTQRAGDDAHVVAFIMPGEYTLDTLPKPKSDRIQIREIPARTVAVIRFSLTGKHAQMLEKENKLREALERDGVEVTGPPTYARYDPPWTVPVLRRNEVMLPVRWDGGGESAAD